LSSLSPRPPARATAVTVRDGVPGGVPGVPEADLAELEALDPPPASVRDVKARLRWRTDRAAAGLRAYRAAREPVASPPSTPPRAAAARAAAALDTGSPAPGPSATSPPGAPAAAPPVPGPVGPPPAVVVGGGGGPMTAALEEALAAG